MRILFSTFLFFYSFACTSLPAQTNDSIKTQKLSEVEVSAHIKPSAARSTTPLQVITTESITEQGLQSVSDVVRRFNGVVLKDYGGIGGLKTVAIRGMGAEHTAISYDGITVSNVLSGQVDIGRFALDNISAVSLSISQSDDIFQTARVLGSAGVLNLQTAIPSFNEHNHEGKARITTGSFGLFNPVLDYSHKISNSFAISANGSWQRADGNYPFKQEDDKLLPDRKRKNSDVDIFRTEINIFNNFGKSGDLRAKIYYFDSERGLPGSVTIANDYAAERLWDKNFFTQMVYNTTFSPKLKFRSQAKYDYTFTRYVIEELSDRKTNRYKQHEIYLSNALLYMINNNFSASLAEDLSYNTLNNDMATFADNLPYPKRYNSLTGIAAKYDIKQFTATASLLATYISEKVKNNSDNNTYKRLTPTISASYQPFDVTNLRFRVSYKELFRVPTFTELYYSSISKKLNPELARQFNMGATWVGSISDVLNYVNASLDVYYNNVRDKIIIIPYPFMASSTNLGKVRIKGVDLKLATNISLGDKMNVDINGSYSYMEALDMTDPGNSKTYKNQIQYTPKHSGAITVGFNNPWVNFSYSIVAANKRYFNIQNIKDNRINGYSDHSISLYKKLRIKGYDCYLQGNLLNIWNENYDIIAYYPMPGRSFKITGGFKF
ncbi:MULTISPECIES: TonB-dependent receptor plug domain-containing protein [unclassified Dysgonomonas]|uniref:TonB-dependent receptor plug domain-containing protein n=1 Tax=unclassified Dysgonomonas TaxID=2630389 RepID=UPI0025B9894D|nr:MULTISPECIES: TonB-dependent receptor plug domain-containing protein [unclassified Dysgonomonas]HMM02210.1 TonB-dependent receptor [Dysgonomonas sp.]